MMAQPFCLLCDIEHTQEGRRERRCDLARWEWWVSAIFKGVTKMLFLWIWAQYYKCLCHQTTPLRIQHRNNVYWQNCHIIFWRITTRIGNDGRASICCETLSVHRRAWASGDAILLVESGGWMLYSNVLTKFCFYTFIHELDIWSLFHCLCTLSV